MVDRAEKTLLVIFSGFFLAVAASTLEWRMVHDSPIMMYIGFIIDKHGYVPYRDFFDMNMPGADAAYYLIGRFSQYSDLGFRITDLLYLGAILGITWLWNRKLDWKVATAGALLFGLLYLKSGPYNSLQREYLLILPIVTSLWIASSRRGHFAARSTLVGLLWGIVATMKPQAVIGFPLVVAYGLLESSGPRKSPGIRAFQLMMLELLPALLGFAIPLAFMVIYLVKNDALGSFLDIARNYWPLYNAITAVLTVDLVGLDRVRYLVEYLRQLGGNHLWLVPATVGAYVALFHATFSRAQKRQVVLLLALTVLYGLYPLIAAKFWFYHWLLFVFFLSQASGLCLVPLPDNASRTQRSFPIAVIVVVALLGVGAPGGFYDQLRGQEPPAPQGGRPDQIAEYLRAHLEPGDEVQPLDWTGGAVHAMLLSQAKPATPFIYDFHFYHHLSQPYIQRLRTRFVESLNSSRPRFVIQIWGNDKPWFHGPDTTREFPELQALLDEEYAPVAEGNGYTIYEVKVPTQ